MWACVSCVFRRCHHFIIVNETSFLLGVGVERDECVFDFIRWRSRSVTRKKKFVVHDELEGVWERRRMRAGEMKRMNEMMGVKAATGVKVLIILKPDK